MCPDRPGDAKNPVIPEAWRQGEVAVIGIGTTGAAVAETLARSGVSVYASDVGRSDAIQGASKQLQDMGVETEYGAHDLARVSAAAAVVVSPGIPPNAPPVRAAIDARRDVWSEIDLACLSLGDRKIVTVTGTNGKTTTTALIDHVLRTAGIASVAAGNIGLPLITAVQNRQTDWFVVELSSFQLHYSRRLTPSIGVLTNLAPDHMDWYGSADDYYADKKRMFLNAGASSHWITTADQTVVADLMLDVPGRIERFSVKKLSDAWFDRGEETLVVAGETVLQRDGFSLLGDHNVANALAAILVAKRIGLTTHDIARGLESVRPLPHRLETILIRNDVRWVNDSKATNVASASAALDAIDGPIVLILGGRGKGEDYSVLARALGSRGRKVLVYGEAASTIAKDLAPVETEVVETLDDAVDRANDVACAGDTVLLSPACASFDQYENYMMRGDTFRKLVQQL